MQNREQFKWTREQLNEAREEAIEEFRRDRMREPLEAYVQAFDDVENSVMQFMEKTANLSALKDNALEVLTNKNLLLVFRYLVGPPISSDDLKTLTRAQSLSPSAIRHNSELVNRLIDSIENGLDRRRFPWIKDERSPSAIEFKSAVLASAAMIASQRVATTRRNESKARQEQLVCDALIASGFEQIPKRTMRNPNEWPPAGQFCGEAILGSRKADLIVRLWDWRIMPIECKVSNSSLNSVKRLNNDAAAKAVGWIKDEGERNIVPVALLSGVYRLLNLEEAQTRGLTIFWSHKISDLIDWIESTKP